MPIRTLIVVVLALAAFSGCGRRGDLEAPGATAAPATAVAPSSAISPLDPGSTGASRPEDIKQETAPERRFLLDFLL